MGILFTIVASESDTPEASVILSVICITVGAGLEMIGNKKQ